METVTHTVAAMQPALRQAAEILVGHQLAADQQVIVQVVDAALPVAPANDEGELPAWCRVLVDLTGEEEAALQESIQRRSRSRDFDRDDP